MENQSDDTEKETDRALLSAVGTALFGETWKQQLADALMVDDRSVRRWLQSGQVPDGCWADLLVLLQQRRVEIGRLEKAVRNRAATSG